MNQSSSVSVVPAEPIFGWRNATIDQATERLSQRGEAKLLLRLKINDAAAAGRIVYGHLSLGDSPRAKALVVSLKKALGVAINDPLPELAELVGKEIRVCISPWVTFDGQTRESVSGFASVPIEVKSTEPAAALPVDEPF